MNAVHATTNQRIDGTANNQFGCGYSYLPSLYRFVHANTHTRARARLLVSKTADFFFQFRSDAWRGGR